jgi:hypothetical protein
VPVLPALKDWSETHIEEIFAARSTPAQRGGAPDDQLRDHVVFGIAATPSSVSRRSNASILAVWP